MKKDILYISVKQVVIVIVPSKEGNLWQVYLINRNKSSLEIILVTSKGYNGDQKTLLFGHVISTLDTRASNLIESISPKIFHFTNEFWISFNIGKQIYGKKHIYFLSLINTSNLSYIKKFKLKSVLDS